MLKALGISVNTMTLGGLAVAIGELVDDAIVDVENVHRRLRENAQKQSPLPSLAVVYRASSEVRGSIVFATAVVVLVFVPLFAMGGIEGRLFAPLGAAYLISILASLLVSLTVTPALCSLLLPAALQAAGEEGRLVRFLKRHDAAALERTLDHPGLLISMALALVGCAVLSLPLLGREFLPAFNEGTATISLLARPGTSLEESNRIGLAAERLLLATPEVLSVGRRTGRAEQDEHAEGVHSSELDVDFKPEGRPRQVVLDELRRSLGQLPGVTVNLGQPISHRLDHLLSGVRAQLAVKLFGPDLEALRGKAAEVQHALSEVPGVVDLQVEQQLLIPELKIRVRREDAARYGLEPGALTERLEGALAGRVVAQVVEGPRTVDIVVRYDEASRKDVESLKRALFDTPSGARVPLAAIADVEEGTGPNLINHENGQRRLVVSANVAGRDLGAVVDELRARVSRQVTLPQGMTLSFEGQLESRESATRLIALLSLLSLLAMIAVLHAHFRSPVLVALVLLNIPLAMVGSVAALLVTSRTLSVATLVGFVTLCGIASRNTIMMLSHYLHLVAEEGERFDRAMVIRGSLERLVPVLMTALTAALGLVPLALAHGEAGKEILQPMAVVILGGLFSSTLLDVLLTPAMFLRFGEKAVARHVERQRQGDGL